MKIGVRRLDEECIVLNAPDRMVPRDVPARPPRRVTQLFNGIDYGFNIWPDRQNNDENSPTPVTMRRYQFRGTPSSVLIGRAGVILHQTFGAEEGLVVGARIAMALATSTGSE